jgi:hypothetical protein
MASAIATSGPIIPTCRIRREKLISLPGSMVSRHYSQYMFSLFVYDVILQVFIVLKKAPEIRLSTVAR